MTMRKEVDDVSTDGRLAYRVKAFCDAVGIGPSKFYEMVADGKIRTVIIGGRRLVPAEEARRLVREGCP